MPDPDGEELRPATREELADSLAFALRVEGRTRVHHADDFMARIAAERLVEHMLQSRFVMMKRPPPDLALQAQLPLKD